MRWNYTSAQLFSNLLLWTYTKIEELYHVKKKKYSKHDQPEYYVKDSMFIKFENEQKKFVYIKIRTP